MVAITANTLLYANWRYPEYIRHKINVLILHKLGHLRTKFINHGKKNIRTV